MNSIRRAITYTTRVKNCEEDPECNIGISLQSLLPKSKGWYNTEDWAKSTFGERLIHAILWVSMFILWTSVAAKSLMDDINLDSMARICGSISISFGGLILWYRVYDHGMKRDLITNLTRAINVKVLYAKKSLDQDEIRDWNFKYVLMFWAVIFFNVSLSSYYLSLIVWSIYYGEHYLGMALPFNRPSYGLAWTLELVFQETVVLFAVSSYTFCESIFVDCILQLAFLYSLECKKLRELDAKDPLCEDKIVGTFKEFLELNALHQDFLTIIRGYMFFFQSVVYGILGLATVCVTLEMRKGVLAVLAALLYPIYVLGCLGAWSFIGTYFEENAGEMNWAMYSSNWIEMKPRVKKIIVIMMTLHQETPVLAIPPFYVFNRDEFASVLKKTYQLYAIVINLFL